MRIRFDERDLTLLRGAEQLRGASYAQTPRPEVLRTALTLARAGHKLTAAAPGASISLDEFELELLVDALRFASQEVHWAARIDDGAGTARRDVIVAAFPELVDKGVWRSFGLIREVDALAARLKTALSS